MEFCKILLNLQDSLALSQFTAWRHGAMVALLVTAPVQVRVNGGASLDARPLCEQYVPMSYVSAGVRIFDWSGL